MNLTDNYNKAPELYWFTANETFRGEYTSVWAYGLKYVGYLVDPEDSIVYRYDLRYVGYGDINWITEKERKSIV